MGGEEAIGESGAHGHHERCDQRLGKDLEVIRLILHRAVDEKEVERRYDHKAHERAEGSGVDVDGRHGGEVVVEDDLDHATDEHRENGHMHAAVGLQDGV